MQSSNCLCYSLHAGIFAAFGFSHAQLPGTVHDYLQQNIISYLLICLADSISGSFGSDCLAQQQVDPNVCCETVDGITSFCFIQCNLPLPNNCVCVDSATGDRLDGLFTFPMPDPNDPNRIDCDTVLPTMEPGGNTIHVILCVF